MSDRGAEFLRQVLLGAVTAASILAALARALWHNARDGAKCPDNRVPAPAVLTSWLPECPAEAWTSAIGRDVALPVDIPNDARPDGRTDAALPIVWWIQLTARDHDPASWPEQVARLIVHTHKRWLLNPDLPHPLAPLVAAWQRRPGPLSSATVTATAHDRADGGMIRRPAVVSTLRRIQWRPDVGEPLVTGAVVDGAPMAAPRADTSDLFPVRKRRPRRRFKPGEQRTLPLPVVPPIHHDLRLIALAELSGAPALQGDVLALMAFAWAADRPLNVTGMQGAALLARARDGTPRAQIKPTDVARFWEAAYALRALVAWDPGGTGAWADLATVEVPRVSPVDRVTIGPPAWARAGSPGKWTLTAEASGASIARGVSGKQGMAGRIITGIEYRLAAGWTGRANSVAPDLCPADRRRKASAGPVVELDWRTVLLLAGDWWDKDDSAQDEAANDRYRRAVATLRKRGYFVPGTPRAEAPAGDSVEIVDTIRGHRGQGAGLLVRASARFVQAARLAQQPQGRGFETRLLTDWAGL